MQKYFTNSINSQNCTSRQNLTISQKSQNNNSLQKSTNTKYTPNYKNMQYSELLEKLLMFVTYCAYELKCNVRSIPSIMSSIRYGMVTRLVHCCTAFDDEILKAVKLGASKLLPVLFDHACNHAIMPATMLSMNDINLWYNVCMLKSYKSLSIKDMRPLLLKPSCY